MKCSRVEALRYRGLESGFRTNTRVGQINNGYLIANSHLDNF